MTQLTQHFALEEFTRSNTATARKIDNALPEGLLPNIQALAEMLERIRSTIGVPVSITSGYRCPRLNEAVGSFSTSDHTTGQAADILAPGFGPPTEVAKMLAPLVDVLGIGQIILEGVRGKQWVHVSTRPVTRAINRVITITDAGTVPGIVELA